ncbi:hypothetical protein BaRGS_00038001, partial [Batillaria attramentaria]
SNPPPLPRPSPPAPPTTARPQTATILYPHPLPTPTLILLTCLKAASLPVQTTLIRKFHKPPLVLHESGFTTPYHLLPRTIAKTYLPPLPPPPPPPPPRPTHLCLFYHPRPTTSSLPNQRDELYYSPNIYRPTQPISRPEDVIKRQNGFPPGDETDEPY